MTPDFPDDSGLIAAWLRAPSRAEGQEAFAVLARRYGGLVYHAALRRTGRPELAQEAAQNTLALLARRAGSLDAARPLAAWLHRTACWQAGVIARGEKRHAARVQSLAAAADAGRAPDERVEPQEWERALPELDAALDALPAGDRDVLLMKYFHGWSYTEIARRCGGEPAAWRQRGSRALNRLRQVLARRSFPVPLPALAAGLGAALAVPAPAALTAPTAASVAISASTALPWTVAAAHAWHFMTAKQVAAAATLLAALFAPLALQRAAIARTQARVAVLESTAARQQQPLEPAVPVSLAEAGAPADPAPEDPIDSAALVALAEAASTNEAPGAAQIALFIRLQRRMEALPPAEQEAVVQAAENLDLVPFKRAKGIAMLLSMIQGRAPERAASLSVALMPRLDGGRAVMLGSAGKALHAWAVKDPPGASAWFEAQRDAGAFDDPGTATDSAAHLQLQLAAAAAGGESVHPAAAASQDSP